MDFGIGWKNLIHKKLKSIPEGNMAQMIMEYVTKTTMIAQKHMSKS
jgi:hypothetical protein